MEKASITHSGHKPSVKVTANKLGHCLTQDLIWQLVRKLRKFDVEDLVTASAHHLGGRAKAIKRRTIQDYVKRLTLGGYLEKTVVQMNGCQQECSWELIRDIGTNTPRLAKDGKPNPTGAIRDHIWRTIKIIGEFNCVEVAAAASTETVNVTITTARAYIRLLHLTGYLVQVRAPRSRITARYRKIPSRCKGKAPLVLKNNEVFDRNLMEVMSPVR